MKVTKAKAEFQPITVVIETKEELSQLLSALARGARECSDTGAGASERALRSLHVALTDAKEV